MDSMSFFQKFTQEKLESGARTTGKNIAVAMVSVFKGHKSRHSDQTDAWLARKTMETRPQWKQISEKEFEYKSAEVVTIADGMDLKTVIGYVVHAELVEICGNMAQDRFMHLYIMAMMEVTRYLKEHEKAEL